MKQKPPVNDLKNLEATQKARRARYTARRWLLDNSSNERVAGCGMATTKGKFVSVNLGTCPKTKNSTAAATNLITCGSLWLCPTCSRKIANQRANEIGDAAKTWSDSGGKKLFATFTLRHNAKMPLSLVWDALSGAWRSFLSGKGWLTLKRRYEIAGWVRAVEVTHGKNGWHVHAHTIFFLQPGNDINLTTLVTDIFSRWREAVTRQGFTADRSAFDIRRTYSDSLVSRYLSDGSNKGLGQEIAQGAFKTSITPFTILYRLADTQQTSCACQGPRIPGNRCDKCLWSEWEATATGRRQLSWSVGLRNLIIANSPVQKAACALSDSVPVIAVGVGSWQKMIRRGTLTDFYDCLETQGVEAAICHLERHGLFFKRLNI